MSKNARELGRLLQEARKRAGMTQEALADAAGIHRTYVGKVERGEKEISVAMAMKLADAAGVPLWKIIQTLESRKSAASGGKAGRNG